LYQLYIISQTEEKINVDSSQNNNNKKNAGKLFPSKINHKIFTRLSKKRKRKLIREKKKHSLERYIINTNYVFEFSCNSSLVVNILTIHLKSGRKNLAQVAFIHTVLLNRRLEDLSRFLTMLSLKPTRNITY
jgi:hypothetical protein